VANGRSLSGEIKLKILLAAAVSFRRTLKYGLIWTTL